MRALDKVSLVIATVGVAGLLAGLMTAPGIGASFSDRAEVGASITVAEAFDCEEDEPDCPEPTAEEPDLLARGPHPNALSLAAQVDGKSVSVTAIFTAPDESDAPTGEVTFAVGGGQPSSSSICRPVDDSALECSANVTIDELGPGAYTATATFSWLGETYTSDPVDFTILGEESNDPNDCDDECDALEKQVITEPGGEGDCLDNCNVNGSEGPVCDAETTDTDPCVPPTEGQPEGG